MAVSQYDKEHLSQAQQDKIQQVTDAAKGGSMSWADAHKEAESIRSEAGYSGGRYGDGYFSVGDDTGGFGNASSSGSSGKSSGGGASSASDLTDYLKDMYAQNLEAQLAGLKSSYDQNVADLQAEAEAIPKRYYEARNETAAQNDIAREYFNELAAANGLNSGPAGQAALAHSAPLQGTLSRLSEQEKDALSANALEQNKLSIAYENAINEAKASGNAALAQALYQEYVRQEQANMNAALLAQEQENWQAQFDTSRDQWQQEFDTSKQQWQDSMNAQNRESAYNLAMTMLAAGVMPDAATLTTAGISSADAAAIRQAVLGGTGSAAASRSSASSGASAPQSSPAANYNNGGLSAQQIKELQNFVGVSADGMWGEQSAGAANGADAATAWNAYETAMGVSDYDSAVQALKKNGASRIPMTQTEFVRHKNAGNSDYAAIPTYRDYLSAFVFSALV